MDTKQVLTVGLAVLGAATMPSMAAQESIKGTFALPGESEKAVGALIVKETGPLTRELSIAFTDKATGQPIVQFDEELTQRLHVLATDSHFTSFIHEHAAKLGADGRFKVAMKFPGRAPITSMPMPCRAGLASRWCASRCQYKAAAMRWPRRRPSRSKVAMARTRSSWTRRPCVPAAKA